MIIPWVIETIGGSIDLMEVGNIKSQFDACNERILETVRTGTTNRCFFNVNRGAITGKQEGLSYQISSPVDICDPHGLIEIDPRKHIWQECTGADNQRVLEMLWMFPRELNVSGTGFQGSKISGSSPSGDIGFSETIIFRTISVYVVFEYPIGSTGSVIEMSRTAITNKNVTLTVEMR
jgi:hypothetical protein